MSKKNPELLDAGITGWFFFRDREKHIGKAPLVGFFDFFKVRKTFRNKYFYSYVLYIISILLAKFLPHMMTTLFILRST